MKLVKKFLILNLILSSVIAAAVQVDEKIASYKKEGSLNGQLSSVGSDTLNNLMTFWGEKFKTLYPEVVVQVEGKGSSTAAPALTQGTAQLAPMSRTMKKEEIEAFTKKHGFEPLAVAVALDSLAVYVHKDNPIEKLSLVEVDTVFSVNRTGGYEKELTKWGELGLNDTWKSLPISLYGRNSASGTYGYFKEHALFKGDFKNTVKEQPGSSSVVQGVAKDKTAMGYSGIGFKTSDVKTISLSKKVGETAYEPSYENVLSGKYPLGRLLYIYVARKPNEPLDAKTSAFLKFVLSKEGQEIVLKDGFLPLTADLVQKQLGAIQ